MRILIDTNIVLDILLARTPFLESAQRLVRVIEEEQSQAYLTANSITDIVYVARKTRSQSEIKQMILDLMERVEIIGIDREDIEAAFSLDFSDFEDALQSACSEKEDIDYIVTRNGRDFGKSNIKAITPADFLARYEK